MLNKNINHFESTKIKSNESHTSNLLDVTVQMLVTVQKNATVLAERYLHLLKRDISVNMTSPN